MPGRSGKGVFLFRMCLLTEVLRDEMGVKGRRSFVGLTPQILP